MTDLLADAFATSILAKVTAVRSVTDRTARRRLLEAIDGDIRKYAGCCGPAAVSEAALAEAKRRGIDLWSLDWHRQPRVDPGRKVFHHEHQVTVATVRSRCLAAASVDEIAQTLREQAPANWLLKSEDATLTKLGFKFRRDPTEAYAAAEIKLVREVPVVQWPEDEETGFPMLDRKPWPDGKPWTRT